MELESETTTFNILFVCTGNTCRSPLAQVATEEFIRRRSWKNVAVASAGVGAVDGSPASPNAVSAATERGYPLHDHVARLLTASMVEWADIVLGMTPSHLHVVDEMGGAGKSALLTAFIPGDGAGQPVPDPFGTDQESYREVLSHIEAAVESLLDELEPLISP